MINLYVYIIAEESQILTSWSTYLFILYGIISRDCGQNVEISKGMEILGPTLENPEGEEKGSH